MIPTPLFIFNAASLQWTTVLKNFEIQWKALKERKDEDPPEIPKITKLLPTIKWTEAFQDFLNFKIGNHVMPLAYIIHDDPTPTPIIPVLALKQLHSANHGSLEAELITQALHTHALYHMTALNYITILRLPLNAPHMPHL